MDRRYRVEITDVSGNPINDARGNPIGPYDSVGKPGALEIEFDVQSMGGSLMTGDSCTLVIRGLPMAVLSQSVNLYNAIVTVYAGFDATGLPLARAQAPHYGMILKGQVFVPFANWQGINQSLNLGLINYTPVPSGEDPIFFILAGEKGEDLATVALRGLVGAFPNAKISTKTLENLVLPETVHAVPYQTLSAYSQAINSLSRSIVNRNGYGGIQIYTQKDFLVMTDLTGGIGTSVVTLTELIGQPTWVGLNTVSLKIPMRADLNVGDTLTLQAPSQSSSTSPYGLVDIVLSNNAGAAQLAAQGISTFSGNFVISTIRHVGSFRDTSPDAWVTIVEAITE